VTDPEVDGRAVPPRREIWRDRRKRSWARPRKADVADALRAGGVGLILGFLGGLLVFFVGSSRGLDAPGFQTILLFVGGVGLVIAIVVSLARAAFSSISAVVAVALFVVGAIAAYGNGLRIVPGNTTDGTLEAVVRGDLADKSSSSVSGSATCRWTDRTVTTVTSRGSFTWTLSDQATMQVDVAAGTATAIVTSRADGSVRTVNGGLASVVTAGARGTATFPRGAIVRWNCPPLP
jgi:hypothetical protein